MRILSTIFTLCLAINAQAALGLRAAGAWTATSAASVTPAIPAAQVTGDMMILIAAGKPYNLTWSSGWTSIGRGESGTTAAGINTGSMVIEIWYKVATSDTEADPTVTESGNSFNVVQAAVCVFSKASGDVWSTPVAVFGADETTGTSVSITFASDPGGLAGDYVMLGCGINSDEMGPLTTDLTSTWSGITFGSYDPAIEGEGTTGGDMASHYRSVPVSSGTSGGAPTASGTGTTTGGSGDRLEGVFIRLRATTPTTSIKDVMGLTYSSVKTVQDLVVASIKAILDLP